MIETRRELQDGSIVAETKNFSVTITDNSVTVRVAGEIVSAWRLDSPASVDTASPRATVPSRRRGSR
jgi:hypothetical protein